MKKREIKFRAWDKIKQQMVYDQFPFLLIGGFYALKLDPQLKETRFLMIDGDAEFMQFTGLKDKNGKEIYESDIVEIPFGGHRAKCVVVFGDNFGNPAFVFRKINSQSESDFECAGEQRKVIGNIYETPELLTGENNVK